MTMSENHPEGDSTSSLLLKVRVYRGLDSQFLLLIDTVTGSPVRSVTVAAQIDLSRIQLHISRQVKLSVTSRRETFAASHQSSNEMDQSLLNSWPTYVRFRTPLQLVFLTHYLYTSHY